jgi:hypothetical protein
MCARAVCAACVPLQVSDTLGVFDALLSLHSRVSSSSQAMSSNTEALLAQKATLTEFADALRARLKFFDEYELAANQFASAAAAPDSAELMPLLQKLDECISYVAANPQYADAVTYANKFRQLQLKALGLVRGRVQSVLRSAAQAVQAAAAEAAAGGAGTTAAAAAGASATSSSSAAGPARTLSGRSSSGVMAGGRVPLLPEGQEVSVLYVRFRAAAEPSLRGALRCAVLCCAVLSCVGYIQRMYCTRCFQFCPVVALVRVSSQLCLRMLLPLTGVHTAGNSCCACLHSCRSAC